MRKAINKDEPKDLTISQLETYFSSASQYHREISEIFTIAIQASESLAQRYGRSVSVLKQFLQNKQDEYLSHIESWLQVLTNQISETETENRKVQSNQALINETIDFMREKSDYAHSYGLRKRNNLKKGEEYIYIYPFPLPEKVCVLDQKFVLSSIDSHTYNQSCQIQRDLKSIKVYLLEFVIESEKKLSKFSLSFYSSINLDLAINFEDLENHQKLLLVLCFMLCFAIITFVAALYGAEGFTMILIVILIMIIGLRYIFLVKKYQKQKKQLEKLLKNIQSILYKLNTQWKE